MPLTAEDRDAIKAMLTVNEHSLEQDCLRHPRHTLKWVMLEADAAHAVSLAKAELDATEARIRRAVRGAPAEYGLKEKPTEGAIGEVVATEPEYAAALAELNEAKHEKDQISGIVAALVEKRRAVERLVELKQIDYYAEPRPRTPASREAMSEAAKKTARLPVGRDTKGD